jgi:hypothetical protein
VFELSDIKNRQQWQDFLLQAKKRTSEVLRVDPSWSLALSVAHRLDSMELAVAAGRTPTQEERDYGKMLGVIAVRNFDDSDAQYSHLLKELSYAFEFWDDIPE